MKDKALAHLKIYDPLLYKTALTVDPILEKIGPDEYFTRLIRSIIGQQLSVKAARTIFARFQDLFPKHTITPEKILELDTEKLRACGISYPKIKYINDLAQRVVKKELILETIHENDDETIITHLTTVKGIGRWSAEMFLMFGLARPDIFSVKDLGIRNAMKKLYNLTNPTEEELIEISERWKPYRTFACMVLWKSLDNEPK